MKVRHTITRRLLTKGGRHGTKSVTGSVLYIGGVEANMRGIYVIPVLRERGPIALPLLSIYLIYSVCGGCLENIATLF